jgi:hypothetical protein
VGPELARCVHINLDTLTESLAGVDSSIVSRLIDGGEIKKIYLSHNSNITHGVGGVSSPLIQYSVIATIMFKDIHPLFEVMPISKSLNFKIQVFWNNSAFTATYTETAGGVEGVWSAQSSQYRAYNGTIRTSVYVGDTCHDSTQKNITVASTLPTGAVGKQVELWVPAYQMLEDIETNYAESHMKTITFNDYYQFSLKGVGSGETFNHLVSNGISNLKSCLIVPLLSSLNNNVNVFDDGLPQSFAHINNFNVLVGGSNVLHQDSRYGYQQFNNDFFNEFGINGNQSPGIGPSLIDFKS